MTPFVARGDSKRPRSSRSCYASEPQIQLRSSVSSRVCPRNRDGNVTGLTGSSGPSLPPNESGAFAQGALFLASLRRLAITLANLSRRFTLPILEMGEVRRAAHTRASKLPYNSHSGEMRILPRRTSIVLCCSSDVVRQATLRGVVAGKWWQASDTHRRPSPPRAVCRDRSAAGAPRVAGGWAHFLRPKCRRHVAPCRRAT